MDSKPMVANFLVVFTKEATSKLGLDKNAELRNVLTNVCINFRHYSADSAIKALFALFYGDSTKREKILKNLFYSTHFISVENGIKDVSPEFQKFNNEEIEALATELLNQYSAAHPDFLKIDASPEYAKEFKSLKEAMCNQPVLFYRAVQMCKTVCHMDNIVYPCVNKLVFGNVPSQMQGLSMIGHNFQHRMLLLPFSSDIGRLLLAMNNTKSDENVISPFETWLNQNEESDFTFGAIEQPLSDEPHLSLLLDEFERFLNGNSELLKKLPDSIKLESCLIMFRDNLNNLLEKKEYLHLANAIVTWLYANKSFQEAQKDFSMGNEDSIFAFARGLRNMKKADSLYASALAEFIASCFS